MKTMKCPSCNGTAITPDGQICHECMGFGLVPDTGQDVVEDTISTGVDNDYPHAIMPLPEGVTDALGKKTQRKGRRSALFDE